MINLAVFLNDFADGIVNRGWVGNIGIMGSDFGISTTGLLAVWLQIGKPEWILVRIRILFPEQIHEEFCLPGSLIL